MNTLTTQMVTMTSLEMVDFINSQRKEGEAELAHYDFLKKVPVVLGEAVAGNFSGYYKASNGKQNPCYNFPKREACLMAMSYSYDLQAKVYDRMTALESTRLPVMSNAQILAAVAAQAAEQEQRLTSIESKLTLLAAQVPQHTDYFTILGYCRLMGHSVANTQANLLGRKAAKRSKELGVEVGAAPDTWGTVGTYREDVLKVVFDDFFELEVA